MHAFEHVVEDARRQSHWPESVLDAARDAAAAARANGTTSSSEVEWTVLAWVTSLPDVNQTLANALLEPLAQLLGVSRGEPCPTSAQLGYIRALGASASADDIKALLMSGPILEILAQTLHTAATAFREQRAATAAELLLQPQALRPKMRSCGAAHAERLEALARRARELDEGPELMAVLAETLPLALTVSDTAIAGFPLVYVNQKFIDVTGYDKNEGPGGGDKPLAPRDYYT